MKKRNVLSAAALAASLVMLAGCGSGGEADVAEDVTLTWWHNSNTDPGMGFYELVAADFEANHPGVDIEITALPHAEMLAELEAGFKAGKTPDVYMERGGGELVAHVEAGLVRDISVPAADKIIAIGGSVAAWQVEGKTYALPFSMGVVGFWYNTDLFAQAGITEAPATMTDFYAAIAKLKAAGIVPLSVGAGDKWPAAHYWYNFALRSCSQEVLTAAVSTKDFSDACFVSAGDELKKLIDAAPFNEGHLETIAQTGPTSASGLLVNGQVAMELAGHWEPGVMQGLTPDKTGLGDRTGWFSFPAVEGGAGDPAAQLGGGDAWACGADAPDICAEFVTYLLSDEVQIGFAENAMGLPTNPAGTGSVADPALADLLSVRDQAPYVQLYFDTLFGAKVGGAMNDGIDLMFRGQATAQDIVNQTQAAADAE